MNRIILCAGMALLAACSSEAPREAKPEEPPDVPQPSNPPVADIEVDGAAPPSAPAPVWESIASGEGTALRLTAGDDVLVMSISCLGAPARLVVNVPGFEPVRSEDHFVLGLGSEPVTLVADPYRQETRPGVTGEGPVPDNFTELVERPDVVRALYGYQKTGPFPAPSSNLKELLVKGCAG